VPAQFGSGARLRGRTFPPLSEVVGGWGRAGGLGPQRRRLPVRQVCGSLDESQGRRGGLGPAANPLRQRYWPGRAGPPAEPSAPGGKRAADRSDGPAASEPPNRAARVEDGLGLAGKPAGGGRGGGDGGGPRAAGDAIGDIFESLDPCGGL